MRFLCAVAAFCVILAGCGPGPRGGGTPELTAFLKDDIIAAGGVRLEELRKTATVQKLRTETHLPQIEDLSPSTGFDWKDASELLIGTDGQNAITVARGNFSGSGKPGGAFTLIDPHTALAGPEISVRAAIDHYRSGNRGGPGVLKLARSLPAEKQIWAVAHSLGRVLGDRIPKTGNAAKLGRAFASLESVTFAADFRNGVNAVIAGDTRNAAEAKAMAETVRGLASLARLNLPKEHPEFGRIFDGIHPDANRQAIRIAITVPQDVLNSLLDWLNAHPRR